MGDIDRVAGPRSSLLRTTFYVFISISEIVPLGCSTRLGSENITNLEVVQIRSYGPQEDNSRISKLCLDCHDEIPSWRTDTRPMFPIGLIEEIFARHP